MQPLQTRTNTRLTDPTDRPLIDVRARVRARTRRGGIPRVVHAVERVVDEARTGIQPVETVAHVRRVARLHLVLPDELHDLVLALTRSVRTSENNRKVLPVLVLLDLLQQKEMDHLVELLHEPRTR